MKKQYVIQEVSTVYEHESAEGGADHVEYKDIEFMGWLNPMGPYDTVEEAEKGIEDLLKCNPHGELRIDTRYVS